MAEPAGFRVSARRHDGLLAVTLGALTLLRLLVAGSVPLSPDEAYYWVFSRALAAGYPDHPPMVALWIRAGTMIAGHGSLGVRLLGPLSAAFGSLLLYDAAARLLPGHPDAPIIAPVLLNATLLFGVGTVIMTPDTPLLFFWICCLWALARLISDGQAYWWLAVGLFAGLALASKYTAVLLWIGIGASLLIVPTLRHWWRSSALWAGASFGALVFLPVVLWNAHHGWVSFFRQGGRLGAWQPARAIQYVAELIAGQAGLATPLLFVLFLAGTVWVTRCAWRTREPGCVLLAALILPGTALFLQHAMGDRVQGNWPAILYPAAGIGAAGLDGTLWRRLRGPAIALGLGVTAVVYIEAGTFVLPLPIASNPIAHQIAGWDTLAHAVEAARRSDGADFVAADNYSVASELARRGLPVLGVGARWQLLNLPAASIEGQSGILISTTPEGAPAGWRDARLVGEAAREQGGTILARYSLWHVSGPYRALAVLPRIDSSRFDQPIRG